MLGDRDLDWTPSMPLGSVWSKNGFRETGRSGGVNETLKVGVTGEAVRFRKGLLEDRMMVERGEEGRSVSSSRS